MTPERNAAIRERNETWWKLLGKHRDSPNTIPFADYSLASKAEDIDALLAEIERLEEENADLRDSIETWELGSRGFP